MMQKAGLLPVEYQVVDYLYRSAQYSGPVALISASLLTGDRIETGSKRINATGQEQAICGDAVSLEIAYKTNGIICTWNGSTLSSGTIVQGDIDTVITNVLRDCTLKYFGIYRYGNYKLDGRIYYMKIYDSNNNLKYNYVPCYRKSDNEPGFYETVNGVFYPNETVPGQQSATGKWEIPT